MIYTFGEKITCDPTIDNVFVIPYEEWQRIWEKGEYSNELIKQVVKKYVDGPASDPKYSRVINVLDANWQLLNYLYNSGELAKMAKNRSYKSLVEKLNGISGLVGIVFERKGDSKTECIDKIRPAVTISNKNIENVCEKYRDKYAINIDLFELENTILANCLYSKENIKNICANISDEQIRLAVLKIASDNIINYLKQKGVSEQKTNLFMRRLRILHAIKRGLEINDCRKIGESNEVIRELIAHASLKKTISRLTRYIQRKQLCQDNKYTMFRTRKIKSLLTMASANICSSNISELLSMSYRYIAKVDDDSLLRSIFQIKEDR